MKSLGLLLMSILPRIDLEWVEGLALSISLNSRIINNWKEDYVRYGLAITMYLHQYQNIRDKRRL